MNQVSTFYRDRMSWLIEIQIFRKRLADIKIEVKEIDATNDNAGNAETKSFFDSVQFIDKEFDMTEKQLLFSLNNGKIYWTDAYHNTYDPCRGNINNENDLFDRMKNGYMLLIELERSINNYLQKTIIRG